MAKAKAKVRKENVIFRYLRETRAELKKVNWPTRQEAWRLTQIVLGVTISMAIFLGLLDWLFSRWLGGILEGNPWFIGLAIAVLTVAIVVSVVLSRRQE